ncbi:MAG: ABC transporter ATP-binding protein [Bacteroidota bacterium]
MLKVEQVSKRFGDRKVLQEVSFELRHGQRLCVVGQSGTGKSVLLRILTGLLSPTSGRIWYDDIEVSTFDEQAWLRFRERFGIVFQEPALFDSLSVFDNIALRYLEHGGLAGEALEARVQEAIMDVGLPERVLGQFPAALSGGMQKRVGVARAILHRPKFLFYDEPTSGLDPINADRIDALILQLAGDDTSSIIITHDMESVRRIATHVLMLHASEVLFFGKTDDFLASEAAHIQAFMARTRVA